MEKKTVENKKNVFALAKRKNQCSDCSVQVLCIHGNVSQISGF